MHGSATLHKMQHCWHANNTWSRELHGRSAVRHTCRYAQAGWAPTAFRSSRDSRAGAAAQQVSDFLDEDELAELHAKGLQASRGYDTFATQAEASARGQAEREAAKRHGGAAEGLTLFPAEALKPVQLSIGMRLLQRMGWRPVRSPWD